MDKSQKIETQARPELAGSAQTVSRRNFLKLSGAVLGASALTCGGLGYLATRRPVYDTVETTCGDVNEMNEKTLITYATRAGSTGEIAQAIADVFCAHGEAAEVRPIKEVRSLDGYRAVVVGSAIRMGRWLPEAVKFVEKHKDNLGRKPTAYFLASMYLRDDTPEMRQTVGAYLDPVRKILEPASIGLFPGKLTYDTLPWLERTMAKSMKEPEGDFRNWEAIRAWAEGLRQAGFAGGQG